MKSLFTMGFSGNVFMAQPRLGQTALPDAEKSKLYDQLSDTDGKQSIIDEWKKNHPNAVADLGAEYARYADLQNGANYLQAVAKDVMKRVESPDPAIVSTSEIVQTQDWMNYIHQMYVIVAQHTGVGPAPPAAASPGLNPVVVAIGAAGLLTLVVVALR